MLSLSPEKILAILCIVAFLIFLWDVLLQLKIKEFDKKIKDMGERIDREKAKQKTDTR